MSGGGLGWGAIVRLGSVQASIGAVTMLATSLLNRLMVVEYGLAAAIPAALVAWHYAVQLSRPIWGHGSDKGARRTPWILGGMAILGLGAMLAVNAVVLLDQQRSAAIALAIAAFAMIGAGVGAAGTSVLAMLASGVRPSRRPAAAATTWIMMVAGIVIAAASAGALLDPYSPRRLILVAGGVVAIAAIASLVAMWGLEKSSDVVESRPDGPVPDFAAAVREILGETEARRFTIFIFVSMLAYSMQDLILEPFAGMMFAMTPGQSTSLSSLQHGGVLIGMIASGIGGSAFAGRLPVELRTWIVVGCLGSALALVGLALAAVVGPTWPLRANVFMLGLANGLFAVAAIGAMMGLAGAGRTTREGVRMGVWGAAQAIAFGSGGLLGAIGVDIVRRWTLDDGAAFQLVFGAEAALFLVAAILAVRAARRPSLLEPRLVQA